jgi:hypothetical protein
MKRKRKAKRDEGKIVFEKEEGIDFFQAVALLIGNIPIGWVLSATQSYPTSHHKHN